MKSCFRGSVLINSCSHKIVFLWFVFTKNVLGVRVFIRSRAYGSSPHEIALLWFMFSQNSVFVVRVFINRFVFSWFMFWESYSYEIVFRGSACAVCDLIKSCFRYSCFHKIVFSWFMFWGSCFHEIVF